MLSHVLVVFHLNLSMKHYLCVVSARILVLSETNSKMFEATLRLLLRPIARLMIANDFQLPRFLELTKRALITEAQSKYAATDSYISLKTGVHRKDVKRLREMHDLENDLPSVATPIAAVLTYWTQNAAFCDAQGKPRPLLRKRNGCNAGFDDLVQQAKIDVPAATVIKELMHQGIVVTDDDGQLILVSDTYIPTLGDAVLKAFQATVVDHVNVAVTNALSDNPEDRAFDRVLRYSHLSQASVDALEIASREAASTYLNTMNKLAYNLQKRDQAGESPATRRFVSGVFIASNLSTPIRPEEESNS